MRYTRAWLSKSLRARPARLLLLAALFALCVNAPGQAEVTQEGDLITSFDGVLAPQTLPRTDPAPIAVTVAGNIKSANEDAEKLPQLRTIVVGINRAGKLYDKGLPTCAVKRIQPATESEAERICGPAIVGHGHATVQVRLPTQPLFVVKADLLAFNGPRKHGKKLILAQIYSQAPPGAFVLPFTVKRKKGVFGTVMSTTLPKSAQDWAYLTHFDMTLDRRFSYRDRIRSYVSAACSAPAGFPGAIFPFARATYGFADGRSQTTTVYRNCWVKK